jgi:GNAT superfamily N-acetyltransferase
MVHIRKAHRDDFDAILALIREFAEFQKTPEKLSITAESLMVDEKLFQCLVAVTPDQKIVGFASYFFAYFSWSGKALWLDDLYIRLPYRNQGIGSKLFSAVRDIALGQKCHKIRWQVSKWNTPAIAFYKKSGAMVDETEMNCDLILE